MILKNTFRLFNTPADIDLESIDDIHLGRNEMAVRILDSSCAFDEGSEFNFARIYHGAAVPPEEEDLPLDWVIELGRLQEIYGISEYAGDRGLFIYRWRDGRIQVAEFKAKKNDNDFVDTNHLIAGTKKAS